LAIIFGLFYYFRYEHLPYAGANFETYRTMTSHFCQTEKILEQENSVVISQTKFIAHIFRT